MNLIERSASGSPRDRRPQIAGTRSGGLVAIDQQGSALQHTRGFLVGDHPTDDVAAENIENDVQVKARPLGRTLQWSERPDVVELSSGLSAPNRTCTLQRIRLSISSVAHSKDEISVTRFEDTALSPRAGCTGCLPAAAI